MKTAWSAIAVAMSTKPSVSGAPNGLVQAAPGHLTRIAMEAKDASAMTMTEICSRLAQSCGTAVPMVDGNAVGNDDWSHKTHP